MGCSISTATAGVVEATKSDAEPVIGHAERPPARTKGSGASCAAKTPSKLAQLAWTTCIIPQVPWPRGYATVTAPSWVTAPAPKKDAPAVVMTPPMEKEKAYIRVATVSN